MKKFFAMKFRNFMGGKLSALVVLLLLLLGQTAPVFADWGDFFDENGELKPGVVDLGEQKVPADWMPDLPDWVPIYDGMATYHMYALPSGETILMPSATTLFFMAMNPVQSGLINASGDIVFTGLGMVGGKNVSSGKDLLTTIFNMLQIPYASELADALISGQDAWSWIWKNDPRHLFGILWNNIVKDKNLYLVYLLYNNCATAPTGCPPELLALMTPKDGNNPQTPQCPAPKATPGQISAVASKTAPNYAIVTGQDPEKRGVDLQFTLTIAPTVFEYYTLEKETGKYCVSPSGFIVDTPPPVEANCKAPNTYREIERYTCEKQVMTFCEAAGTVRATASLKPSSRDWITGELAQWYTGAHLIKPDWAWTQGQGGCDGSNTYRWTISIPRVQVRDPGFYTMKITGTTLGTPVTSPRNIDQTAGEFDVYLKMTRIIK